MDTKLKWKLFFKIVKSRFFIVPILMAAAITLTFSILYFSPLFPRSSQTNNAGSKAEEIKQILAACQQSNAENCYSKELAALANTRGYEFARAAMLELQDKDARTRSCHTIAHSIAGAAVEKNPSGWQDLLNTLNLEECSGGFFHGILEGRMRYEPDLNIDSVNIADLCANNASIYRMGSCAHIMGHLVLVEKYGDIKESVKICNKYSGEIASQCLSGLFMEAVSKQNLQDHGLASQENWDTEFADQTEQMCKEYKGEAAKACWGQIGYVYASINNDNHLPAINLCKKAGQKDWIDQCVIFVVTKISVTAVEEQKLEGICDFFNYDQKKFTECTARVVDVLITTTPKYADRAINFCAQLSDRYSSECFIQISHKLARSSAKAEITLACGKLPAQYQSICLSEMNNAGKN